MKKFNKTKGYGGIKTDKGKTSSALPTMKKARANAVARTIGASLKRRSKLK